jgi:hypothetical protein
MKVICIVCLLAITSFVAPLTALAQGGLNSGDKPVVKPPVVDLQKPRKTSTQTIYEGPIVHDYRAAPLRHWSGTYESVSNQAAYIKRLIITGDKDGRTKIRDWIVLAEVIGSPGPFEFSMETTAEAYRNCNNKSKDDTVIASFEEANYKPPIVITCGTPHLPRNLEGYSYIT